MLVSLAFSWLPFYCLRQWTRKKRANDEVVRGKLIEIRSFRSFLFFADGGLGSGTTISSRWAPVGAGPTLGPADTNGAGVDAKHLDVGDMSDVSDVSTRVSVLMRQLHLLTYLPG
jgi:hypothetical protein